MDKKYYPGWYNTKIVFNRVEKTILNSHLRFYIYEF